MTALTETKGTGAPLRRALAKRGTTEPEELAGADFHELLALHGVGLEGPNRLDDALGERGLEAISGVVAPESTTATTEADLKTEPTGQSPEDWIKSLIPLDGLRDGDGAQDLLDRLGPHRRGAGCVYPTRLDVVDEGVLRELIARGGQSARAR